MQTRRFLFCQKQAVVFLFAYLLLSLLKLLLHRASVNLVFFINNGVVKMFLKTMGRKTNKHRKIVSLVKSKSNSTEKVISKKMKDSYIIHGEFTLVINEEQNYFRL